MAGARRALANNRYSADIVAIPDARRTLADLPDLPTDNALPRWLTEWRGVAVDDLAGRWRLAMDLDTALDLILLGGRWAAGLAPRPIASAPTRASTRSAPWSPIRGPNSSSPAGPAPRPSAG